MLTGYRVATPQLNNVKGAFNLQSSGQLNNTCNFYKNLHDKKLIQSKNFKCEGTLIDPGQQGHQGTQQSGSGSGGDKKGAAPKVSAVNGALGLAAMAAVVLF